MNMNNTNTAGSNNNSAGTNKQPNKQTVKLRKLPIRQCAGCGERFPKNQMIRVLRTPDGEIVLDDTGKKSGRGAMKPFCINEKCSRFLPEDQRGYYKKKTAEDGEATPEEKSAEKKTAAKKTTAKAPAKKTAAKKTAAKKTAVKKTAAKATTKKTTKTSSKKESKA